MRDAGWETTASVPGERREARVTGAMMLAGERIAVRFAGTRLWVASICDPGVGFSLPGRRRCERHRALVLGAIGAATRPWPRVAAGGLQEVPISPPNPRC